jgi:hypothetical protein
MQKKHGPSKASAVSQAVGEVNCERGKLNSSSLPKNDDSLLKDVSGIMVAIDWKELEEERQGFSKGARGN